MRSKENNILILKRLSRVKWKSETRHQCNKTESQSHVFNRVKNTAKSPFPISSVKLFSLFCRTQLLLYFPLFCNALAWWFLFHFACSNISPRLCGKFYTSVDVKALQENTDERTGTTENTCTGGATVARVALTHACAVLIHDTPPAGTRDLV